MINRRLVIIAAIVGTLLIAAIIVAAVVVTTPPKTGVQFIVVPDEITVKSQDRSFKVNYESIVAFEPGTYTLSLSRDGFQATSQDVTVSKDAVTSVYASLVPLTDAAKKIVSTSIMKQRIERIGGHTAQVKATQFSEQYSFVDKLPINDKFYSINPCNLQIDGVAVVGICITLVLDQPIYRERALKALADAGIDASKWHVYFGLPTSGD